LIQTINLNAGKYRLDFDHANRQADPLTNRFSVYWNGVLVKSFLTEDNDIHH